MNKLLNVSFIPKSSDLGLLVLRLFISVSMVFNHGLDKFSHFSTTVEKFGNPMMDVLHLGGGITATLVVIAELLCSVLLALGVATRLAALIFSFNMLVAFVGVHHSSFAPGPHSGEVAYLYLGASLALLFAGSGRFALSKSE
jgi:putative oxidoreductase